MTDWMILSTIVNFTVVLYQTVNVLEHFFMAADYLLKKGENELKEVKANDNQTPLQKGSELKEFSPGVIKDWSDINIKNEIGEGNFGKVYKGYLHLNEVQR